MPTAKALRELSMAEGQREAAALHAEDVVDRGLGLRIEHLRISSDKASSIARSAPGDSASLPDVMMTALIATVEAALIPYVDLALLAPHRIGIVARKNVLDAAALIRAPDRG